MIPFLMLTVLELDYQMSLCSCREDTESVEHVLLRCRENEKTRTVMMDCISNILKSSQCKANHKLNITESLLLVPHSQSNCLSRREDIYCKEALGAFFIASERSDRSSPACLSFFYSSGVSFLVF